MKRLKLQNGLIAIGANKGIGKTKFSILLANKLAKSEKVLFLDWTNYYDNLSNIIEKSGFNFNSNLDIETSVNYFNVSSLLKIINLIDTHNYQTIFVDDLDAYINYSYANFYVDRDEVIKSLKFLVDKFNVRIVFSLCLHSEFDEIPPTLRDFAWSRLIVNECSQVIGLKRTFCYDNDNFEDIEVYELKNETNKMINYKAILKRQYRNE